MTKRNSILRCATEKEIKELWGEWLDWYKKKNGHGFFDGDPNEN